MSDDKTKYDLLEEQQIITLRQDYIDRIKDAKLPPLHVREQHFQFCENYCFHRATKGNHTKSAIAAGYTKSVAAAKGKGLLKSVGIAAYIDYLNTELRVDRKSLMQEAYRVLTVSMDRNMISAARIVLDQINKENETANLIEYNINFNKMWLDSAKDIGLFKGREIRFNIERVSQVLETGSLNVKDHAEYVRLLSTLKLASVNTEELEEYKARVTKLEELSAGKDNDV